jgi:hypothetical protein
VRDRFWPSSRQRRRWRRRLLPRRRTPSTRRPERRWRLGYAAFVLGHEAAHAAGADHSNTDGSASADCVAASHIRLILRRLGQTSWQARRVERELVGAGLGTEPVETERCWQPL